MNPEDQYRLVVDALRLVAAPADEQVASLPDFVCVTDEVATTFGDAFLLVPQLQRIGLISPEAFAAIRGLDSHFGSMSEDESIAEAESLASHPFWVEARVRAEESLRLLGEDQRLPDLSGLRWVKG